ncbi:calcium-binding protein, partial [Litorisediminicola beolgyonensis]
ARAGTAALDEGAAQLATLEIGGRTVLLAATGGDAQLQSFALGKTGGIAARDTLGAEEGLSLMQGVSALETVTAFGQSFAILASRPLTGDSGALSVVRIDAEGGLTVTDHLIDGLETRFGAVSALAVARFGDELRVLAGGGDDGVSLFSLTESGRLVHRETLAHDTGLGLANVEALAMVATEAGLEAVAASQAAAGLSRFKIAVTGVTREGGAGAESLVGTRGDDLLIDGAGADRMEGRDGADRFVLIHDGARDVIADFELGRDVIDLSYTPMFYDTREVVIHETATGARITVRGDVTEIWSADGRTLDEELLRGALEIAGTRPPRLERVGDQPDPEPWPENPFPAPSSWAPNAPAPTPEADEGPGPFEPLREAYDSAQEAEDAAKDAAGRPSGSTRDEDTDQEPTPAPAPAPRPAPTPAPEAPEPTYVPRPGLTLKGKGKDDDLIGRDRDDKIAGKGGDDSLDGQGGNDTLLGGKDDDLLKGGAGDDLLKGSAGNDRLVGGDDDDVLKGGKDDDTLLGGAGDDVIKAAKGNDWMDGEAGDDLLAGGGGNDGLRGGAGDDRMNGGGGDDILLGEDGADVITGKAGRDRITGGTGDDILSGGKSGDVFVFRAGEGQDVITDFRSGQDVLELEMGARKLKALIDHADADGLWLDWDSGGVLLEGVKARDFDAGDVTFV